LFLSLLSSIAKQKFPDIFALFLNWLSMFDSCHWCKRQAYRIRSSG
jgi:hypothetical protein